MGPYYTAFEPCAVTFASKGGWALDTYSTVHQANDMKSGVSPGTSLVLLCGGYNNTRSYIETLTFERRHSGSPVAAQPVVRSTHTVTVPEKGLHNSVAVP